MYVMSVKMEEKVYSPYIRLKVEIRRNVEICSRKRLRIAIKTGNRYKIDINLTSEAK